MRQTDIKTENMVLVWETNDISKMFEKGGGGGEERRIMRTYPISS